MFASESQARIMQTRYDLATMKKNSLSVADYFQKAQNLSHILAAVGEPLKDSELISFILAGLTAEYDPLVTSITTRLDPISSADLYGHLLTFEQRLEQHHAVQDLAISSVNLAQRNTSFQNKPQKSFSHSPGYNSNRGRGRGRGYSRSPSSSFMSQNGASNRPTCQVCFKQGHTAAKCYHRFDHSYHSVPPLPSAFLTAPHTSPDMNWYPDTGSTNHLTNDLSNLNLQAQ